MRALVVVVAFAMTVAASSPVDPAVGDLWLTVRRPDGAVIARSPMRDGDTFILRYRNSLYRSLAEERFVVRDERMVLVSLAADELAVLEEYYRIARRAQPGVDGTGRAWSAVPALPVSESELHVAATDLGRRTLVVPGRREIALWRAVDDRRPTVTLRLEPPHR